MDLEELLSAMDWAAADLARLEVVWERAGTLVPTGPARGSDPGYDELSRMWRNLLVGLPLIDGWTITADLPDLDDIGQSYIDHLDIGELPFAVVDAAEQPGKAFAHYEYLLKQARHCAACQRLQ